MGAPGNEIVRTTVVGVFERGEDARRAVDELHSMGFTDRQIGLVFQDARHDGTQEPTHSYASEGAATGAVAGTSIAAAWAVGIAAGLLPAVGPVIAGGTLAALLASAATGAAVGGIAGALIGMGIPEAEAKHYADRVNAGQTLVSVDAHERYAEAAATLRAHGATVQDQTGEFYGNRMM